MNIKDFMIQDVITATRSTSVKELLELLVNHKIGGVPVVDDENNLQGMISDGDVIRYLQPKGRTVYDMFALVLVSEKEDLMHKLDYAIDHKVENVMSGKDIFTVHPNDELEKALAIFAKHRFKKIPVVNQNYKVVGVVSRGDVIRYISTTLITKADEK
ncbi:CBS domain-containing protein [Virgibacillus phasianinus]|uniref:CBS domain-containing protein n=1 Tax=Virgibacillus phasianinus TaxID=2017483 RepID=A0A220U689_9BACI|nr:CBS domain-containing protein [Virgibacillus phasianinus]ASK63416.1 CBS domain-containing protein [Virgibacillus phasianinus]